MERPVPTGAHHEAIQRLDEAREIMAHFTFPDPAGGKDIRLSDIHDSMISSMIGSIDHHYKNLYWQLATDFPTMIIQQQKENPTP